MGVGYKRTLTSGDVPVFQGDGKDIQLAQGGFLLDITGLTSGAVIPAGTPMGFEESTRVAKVIPTAKVVENAGAAVTAYKVAKGHLLKVGDPIAGTVGGDAVAIASIDTSNADYDTVNVASTIGAVIAGNSIFKAVAVGSDNAAFTVAPKGLLYADTVVDSGESVSVAIRATVYARRIPYSADLETALPRIIFSQSF